MNQETKPIKRTRPIPVRLDNQLLARIKQRAEKEKTNVSDIIRRAIRIFLGAAQ